MHESSRSFAADESPRVKGLTHFSDEGTTRVINSLEAVSQESKSLSSEVLKSLRYGPRESLKVVRQMIKQPIQLLRDSFFDVIRVERAPDHLKIVDFMEQMSTG